MHRRKQSPRDEWIWDDSLLSSLPYLWRGPSPSTKEEKHKQSFCFFLLFSDLFFFVFFWFIVLSFFRWQI
jgi:hypothetical protein